jgi:uncharacterized protein (TIGR02600 family)
MKRIPLSARGDSQGVALIIVLAMLVLLSGLLVAFLTTARTERSAAASDSATAASRQIADSTVSFVISQIRDGTSIAAENTTWASQPGAIRTFSGTLNGSTQPLKDGAYYDTYNPTGTDLVYKLYSADRMRVASGEYAGKELPDETAVIEGWDRKAPTEGYVDLNEPALALRRDLDAEGNTVEPHYPIVDPRAAYTKAETEGSPQIVDGFDAKISTDQTFKLPSGGAVPYVPMPVKWLYVLRDGTIGPASLGTEQNPIVGRTAFWTDDETCKLNINTASEGTFWDTPTVSSMQEMGTLQHNSAADITYTNKGLNLAGSQAIQGEYQRYPGHPATTCLSPVLGWVWDTHLLPINEIYPYRNNTVNTVYNKFKEEIYQISPYMPYADNTSKGATRNTDKTDTTVKYPLKVRTKHLYTSPDEMIFKSPRFKGSPGAGRDPELNAVDKLTPEALEKTRFFLTANSRAPEINLFGRPRVTIWPINADYKYRTAADDLFLFSSTISKDQTGGNNDKRFCLLRNDAKSGTNDFFGTWTRGSFTPDTRSQNTKMFKYLQFLTSQTVPGFGGTFTSNQKFGGSDGRDEVLILIFDYIRTINMTDTGTSTRAANVFMPYTPRFVTKEAPPDDQYGRYDRSVEWSGQVTPLHRFPVPGNDDVQQLQGFGRFITPTEVAVIFHGSPAVSGKQYMQATMAIEMSTVMAGFPGIRETYWTKITPTIPARIKFGATGTPFDIKLCGTAYPESDSLFNFRGLINVPNVGSHEVAQGRCYMPTLGWATAFHYFKEWTIAPYLTSMQEPPHAKDPVRGLTTPDMKPYAKVFDNARKESRYPENDGGSCYVRSTSAVDNGGNGTVSIYPYVSDKIDVTGQANFSIEDLGEYKIEIFVGENPTDPRSALGVSGHKPAAVPVQTAWVRFPQNAPTQPFIVPKNETMAVRPLKDSARVENPRFFIYNNGDIVRSMELTCLPNQTAGNKDQGGDIRIAAAHSVIPREWWSPTNTLANYQSNAQPAIHRLLRGHGDPDGGNPDGANGGGYGYVGNGSASVGCLVAGAAMRTSKPPILPYNVVGVKRADGGPGDWDRGISKHTDGAMGNKVDEGNLKFDTRPSVTDHTGMPYYRGRGMEETGQTFYSPNRQLSSAVMFGSLPTGIRPGITGNKPWQTLLFRPNRETGTKHPGADVSLGPPDHLLLDLFTMPVIEPYAISEPFSTAGKINLNYVIAPFGYARGETGNNPRTSNSRSYLRRDTGLRGVMKSTFIMAVPKGQDNGGHKEEVEQVTTQFRFPIDLDKTIEAMETRLKSKSGDYPLFRSASELCTVDLYPQELSVGNSWAKFWTDTYALTGDNMRERPYAHIYPRVTTKSNVYTVHMRCQAVRKAKGTKPDEFDPDKDAVLGEYRGSATIERFIDSNDEALQNYDEYKGKIDPYYRYRVINTKQFSSR